MIEESLILRGERTFSSCMAIKCFFIEGEKMIDAESLLFSGGQQHAHDGWDQSIRLKKISGSQSLTDAERTHHFEKSELKSNKYKSQESKMILK